MYAYQFMDGTWRIAKLTSSSFVPPVAGEMLDLYDSVYLSRADAERAIVLILELQGFCLKTATLAQGRPFYLKISEIFSV